MDIEHIVSKLVNRFRTRNPFLIAKRLDIQILLNNSLDENEQRLVMAHQLGHAVLHRKLNYYFLRNKTYLKLNNYEREADTFAAYLLISADDIEQCNTVEHLAALSGVPEDVAELRVKG